MKLKRRSLDLQAKIILILVAVIPPTFTIVTVAQNKLTQPILEEEFLQVGVTTAKTLAAEIVSSGLLHHSNPMPAIESSIQTLLYAQPNIMRIDVITRDATTGQARLIATNVEEEPGAPTPAYSVVDMVTTQGKVDENGARMWEISVPIEQKARDPRGPKRLLGTVHLEMSLKPLGRIVRTLWRITVTAAVFTVMALLLVLSYLLRKTISNDRLLKKAETQNLQLSEQLHDAERRLMNTEKLAVMGQLTASFAHEIGSPLNAIGGHLQLLNEDLLRLPQESAGVKAVTLTDRLEIINGQVGKIEEIVKGFLQSTVKPASQRQLTDINQLVDRTLGIVKPRIDAGDVRVKKDQDRKMGPIRIVPLEIEQILLNLLNNSLDSLKFKAEKQPDAVAEIRLATRRTTLGGREWAEVSIYDTGEGIRRSDLDQVSKPFFTTKRSGEGTGLGLAICKELVHKYGGRLEIESKEGAWTQVTFRIPYRT